jgi:DNA-binding Lrp family transcriptional regulator
MSLAARRLSPLSALGFSAAEEQLYRVVLRNSGSPVDVIANLLGRTPAMVRSDLSRLVAVGLVSLERGVVVAEPPEQAVGRLISDEALRLQSANEQLDALRSLLPSLTADHVATEVPSGELVHLQAVDLTEIVPLFQGLAALSTGEFCWLRPDQWHFPVGHEIDRFVSQLVQAGRASRAIYPARVLEEAPDVVRMRADVGENVRILASVPTRMAVFGDDAAVVPEQWGSDAGRVLVIREPVLVKVARSLFENMWERALPVPGMDGQVRGRASDRRLLLDQLAGGAKDEQIARALGLSLRTVRRRVADVLDELGVDSRFQAGVEAVRRGWI